MYAERSSQCFLEEVLCVYQLSRAIQSKSSLLSSVRVTFHNNTAEIAGHDLFGGQINKCYILSDKFRHRSLYVFHRVFVFKKRLSYISSTPRGVCFCFPEKLLNVCSDHHLNVYPGQNFSVEVILVGQVDGPVPGNIVTETEPSVHLAIHARSTKRFLCKYISSNKSATTLTLRANA